MTTEERSVEVRIPAGADDGSELRVRGEGGSGIGNGPPGDLVIRTHVLPHPHFQRDGLDLTLTLPVTLEEAYLGASVPIPTLDGSVQMKVPPRAQTGQSCACAARAPNAVRLRATCTWRYRYASRTSRTRSWPQP